jgi:phosphohistidine phosphatase
VEPERSRLILGQDFSFPQIRFILESMRRLFLLRHAQAAPAQNTEDRHRSLTKDGVATAAVLGQLMKTKGYIPDFVICSPARRTQQTLRKILEATGDVPAIYPQAVYYTTVGQLYEVLKQVDGNHHNVLLVSHNPSIHGLAKFLMGLGPGNITSRLIADYSECTLTVLDCPIDGWSTLMPNQNDLEDLLIPGKDFSPDW